MGLVRTHLTIGHPPRLRDRPTNAECGRQVPQVPGVGRHDVDELSRAAGQQTHQRIDNAVDEGLREHSQQGERAVTRERDPRLVPKCEPVVIDLRIAEF